MISDHSEILALIEAIPKIWIPDYTTITYDDEATAGEPSWHTEEAPEAVMLRQMAELHTPKTGWGGKRICPSCHTETGSSISYPCPSIKLLIGYLRKEFSRYLKK